MLSIVVAPDSQTKGATPLEDPAIGVDQDQLNARDDTSSKTTPRSDGSRECQNDGRRRAWLVVAGSFLLYFNMLGGTYSFGVYEAHYTLHEFPGQSAKISLIGSASNGFALTTSVIAGRWVELYGVRSVTIAGSIIYSASLAAAGFCKTVPTLIVTQGILTGIGVGILNVPGIIAMAPWFPKKQSLVLGIASSGAGLGGIFWSFATRIILSKLSYQWALWISASVSAVLYAIAIVLISNGPARLQKTPFKKRPYREGLKIFKNPKFATFYIANLLNVFGYLVPFFYLPTYAQTQLNSSAFTGAILSAVLNLGMSFGRISLGFFANSSFGTINAVVLSMTFAALCQLCLWIPAQNSIVLLYIFAFVYGIFGGGSVGIMPCILVRIVDPDKLPSITGLFLSGNLPGAMGGNPIAGSILSNSNGKWSLVILYSSLMMLAGTFMTLVTRFLGESAN